MPINPIRFPKCSRCGAPVLWMATNARVIALDAQPTPDGPIVVRDRRAVYIGRDEEPEYGEARYMPHRATCQAGPAALRDGRR